jgi:probable DNA metabolism protein
LRPVAFDGSFAGWRDAARAQLASGLPPGRACWQPASSETAVTLPLTADVEHTREVAFTLRVPASFVRLAAAVACHRDERRWDDLYRVLWRLTHGEPALLDVATDPDVHRLSTMERAVLRAAHKMKAFVRFRLVERDASGSPRYVAWFDPAQHVVERVAPFFVRRFRAMHWSILTPDRCAHWDRQTLHFTPGLPRSAAPRDDAVEELWRTYYANTFNPARLNLNAMRAEMPRRYWSDLPEAHLVRELAREAPRRVAAMLAQWQAPAEPMPADLRAAGSVSSTPDRCLAARVAGSCDRPSALDAAGEWDPTHDPGTLAAADRARRVRARAPQGITIGESRLLVGVAGWTDPTLVEAGRFYPSEVATPEDRLRFYASRFPLVEVDSTYYAMPSRGMAAAWAARTPSHFTFDVKANALMTGHAADVRQLPDWLRRTLPRERAAQRRVYARDLPGELLEEVWRRFLDALAPLREAGKLGAVLLQFPRWFTPSRESAALLRRARERLGDVTGAVEFRHRSWMEGRIAPRTLALLRDLELAYVIVDAPAGTESSMPSTVAVTSQRLAVVRLHGRRTATWEARNDPATERYRYLYDRSELSEWVSRFPDIAQHTQGVHVVHNNCHANYGTTNADEITQMLIEADELRRSMYRESIARR